MTAPHLRELLEAASGRMSRDEYLAHHPEFGSDYAQSVRAGLRRAEQEHDRDAVEFYMVLTAMFGRDAVTTDDLVSLLGQDWHTRHEDITRELQRRRDPASVPALERMTRHVPAYLEWDDNRALAVKALHALEDIGTPEAKRALRELAVGPDPVVAATAARMVARDRPPKGPAAAA